jgi:hypothetical protein
MPQMQTMLACSAHGYLSGPFLAFLSEKVPLKHVFPRACGPAGLEEAFMYIV